MPVHHSYVPLYYIILRYFIVGRTSLKKDIGTEKQAGLLSGERGVAEQWDRLYTWLGTTRVSSLVSGQWLRLVPSAANEIKVQPDRLKVSSILPFPSFNWPLSKWITPESRAQTLCEIHRNLIVCLEFHHLTTLYHSDPVSSPYFYFTKHKATYPPGPRHQTSLTASSLIFQHLFPLFLWPLLKTIFWNSLSSIIFKRFVYLSLQFSSCLYILICSFQAVCLFESVVFKQFVYLSLQFSSSLSIWVCIFQSVCLFVSAVFNQSVYLCLQFASSSSIWVCSFQSVCLFVSAVCKQFVDLSLQFSVSLSIWVCSFQSVCLFESAVFNIFEVWVYLICFLTVYFVNGLFLGKQ